LDGVKWEGFKWERIEMENVAGVLPSNEAILPQLSLQLLREVSSQSSFFWVTFFKEGSLSPSDLGQYQSLSELLKHVDAKGIAGQKEPVLFSKQDQGEPFLLLLLPGPKSLTNQDLAEFCAIARQNIEGIGQKNMGLHLPENFLDPLKTLLFIGEILQKSYLNKKIEKSFISLSGITSHTALNILWKIQNFMKKNGLPITFYH
jgi:hypothetical protein